MSQLYAASPTRPRREVRVDGPPPPVPLECCGMALVTSDPEICGGTPCFAGTRVPVETLFEHLRGGATLEEFLGDFPTVEPWQVRAVLEMAQVEVVNRSERVTPSSSAASSP